MQSDQFNRRELITLLGGTAVAWPFAARAQQRSKVARLGVLLFSTPQGDPQMKAVHIRLRELGYVEGQNVIVIYRYADGKYERLPDLAAELIAEKPDVVLALGGDVAPYAAKATSTTPIVFISSADPVQLGLAASLARPARNATGVTLLLDDTASKRLELLKEVVPRVQRTAFLWNPSIPIMNCQKPSGPPQLSISNCSPWRCGGPAVLKVRCVRWAMPAPTLFTSYRRGIRC
jgi:ABC-type uncharacterized transport system substrate-binding protein